MSIFSEMPNSEKLELGRTMLASIRRDIYRLSLLDGLDPETLDPATYPDPETLDIDPTQLFRYNYSEKVNLYHACQKYIALEQRLEELG